MTSRISSCRLSSVVAAAALSALVAGCAAPVTPKLDAGFGEAVRAARDKQTLDPAAASRQDAATGIDAKAAVHAQDRYHDSFKSPPRTFEVLGIGGSLSGQ